MYDEAARENVQSEEVQKAIKKVAEKNGYRSATKEKLAEIRKKKEDLMFAKPLIPRYASKQLGFT